VLRATLNRRILVTDPVGAPVTVAIGDRDRLLRPRQARHIDQLPPGTHTGDLPGCGHLPMADDPAAVTALIIRSAARSADAAGPASTPQRAA
jgi:pimeloyl-ACP methyl ester carboxylesterase